MGKPLMDLPEDLDKSTQAYTGVFIEYFNEAAAEIMQSLKFMEVNHPSIHPLHAIAIGMNARAGKFAQFLLRSGRAEGMSEEEFDLEDATGDACDILGSITGYLQAATGAINAVAKVQGERPIAAVTEAAEASALPVPDANGVITFAAEGPGAFFVQGSAKLN